MHPNYQINLLLQLLFVNECKTIKVRLIIISDNREQLKLDASRIPQFLCCPCILRKYSHKFAAYQDQACYYIGCCIFQTEFGNKAKIWYFCLIFFLRKTCSVWSVQPQIAGRNIQQLAYCFFSKSFVFPICHSLSLLTQLTFNNAYG